ncbi:hypothetical protein BGZ68_000026 [Mortierella alpina]|nr:hypothetical protein BGZ68_000026 [Mortierella alpina]
MQEMKVGPSSTKEHLLRPQTGQRMKLKEKFVEIYDTFLRGQDPAQGRDPDVFWDELFLIKVNESYLSTSLRQISEDQLLAIKDGINAIFLHAVQTMRDPLPQRRLHAMQTLTIVLGEIFRKKFHNWSFDVIHLLPASMAWWSHAYFLILTVEIQIVALRLAIALACGNDNVNNNSLNEYFMQKDIFASLIKFFAKVESVDLAFEAMALLGLLANYNKYETRNPYLQHISALRDETILRKMSMVIVHTCDKMRRSYIEVMDDDELSAVSKLTSALSYVTGMLWNPKGQDSSVTDTVFAQLPDGRVTVLLVFYDLVYTNKQFRDVFLNYTVSNTTASAPNSPGAQTPSLPATESNETGLGSFLSFASYLLQHNRTHHTAPYTHLCLVIMQLFVEDTSSYPYLCSIPQSQDASPSTHPMPSHPTTSMTNVRLCRQRQPVLPKVKQARPMAAVLLDVILGFLKHNMKKKMQVDCFRIATAIIFALASRFKALRVRLPYHWAEVWNTLQGLVKFLQANAEKFKHIPEARDLVAETIDLVNYFVTFGDLIMPDPASLYALYYEIVRSGIDPFSDLTKDCASSQQRVIIICLSNINQVHTFFFTHLLAWRDANPTRSLGPDLVTTIIKSHYQDLTLVPLSLDAFLSQRQNGLPHGGGIRGHGGAGAPSPMGSAGPHPAWDGYSEVPGKVPFFRQLTRWVVSDLRTISKLNATASSPGGNVTYVAV